MKRANERRGACSWGMRSLSSGIVGWIRYMPAVFSGKRPANIRASGPENEYATSTTGPSSLSACSSAASSLACSSALCAVEPLLKR
jgi:hypothetical protein